MWSWKIFILVTVVFAPSALCFLSFFLSFFLCDPVSKHWSQEVSQAIFPSFPLIRRPPLHQVVPKLERRKVAFEVRAGFIDCWMISCAKARRTLNTADGLSLVVRACVSVIAISPLPSITHPQRAEPSLIDDNWVKNRSANAITWLFRKSSWTALFRVVWQNPPVYSESALLSDPEHVFLAESKNFFVVYNLFEKLC